MVNQEVKAFAEKLVASLPAVPGDGLFNPYTQSCVAFDASPEAHKQRFKRLVSHLDCDSKLILVGEAPGYNGCRYSGIAFTCEHLLLEGSVPRVAITDRITIGGRIRKEHSANTVWPTLHRLGVAHNTIMWNALQLHPFRKGLTQTNRTPTHDELMLGMEALGLLIDRYPDAVLVAVGQKAASSLKRMGVQRFEHVRHPAYGGIPYFVDGLAAIVEAFAGKDQ